jgi:hypothetical protein
MVTRNGLLHHRTFPDTGTDRTSAESLLLAEFSGSGQLRPAQQLTAGHFRIEVASLDILAGT